jgi:hypothetical protein
VPGIELGLDASARPSLETLVRVEPRIWARVGVSVLLDGELPAASPVSAAPAAQSPPSGPPKLSLSVVDPRGWPIPGARVVSGAGGDALLCDDFGRAQLELPPDGAELTIEADHYEPLHYQVLPGAHGPQTVTLAARLPAGEIKGAVRSLSGQPLQARLEVSPSGLVVFSDAQGQFAVEVAPGDYTLRISAGGYETQERPAQVEERGVTIVVVDLRKAAP